MKKDLSKLLIEVCCKGKNCELCSFESPNTQCYLTDIINIIEESKNKLEGDNENEK